MRCRICGGNLTLVPFTEIPRDEWVFCGKHTLPYPMMFLKCLSKPEHGLWFCSCCNRPLVRAFTDGVRLYEIREKLLRKLREVDEAIRYLECT